MEVRNNVHSISVMKLKNITVYTVNSIQPLPEEPKKEKKKSRPRPSANLQISGVLLIQFYHTIS